jgi:hypothetical protein
MEFSRHVVTPQKKLDALKMEEAASSEKLIPIITIITAIF